MSLERSFTVGEFGIKKGCFGIGTGGGFTREYNDLILHQNGRLEAINFQLPAEPDVYNQSLVGQVDDYILKSFWKTLDFFEFFETKPDESSVSCHYVFATTDKNTVHYVTWPDDSTPSQNLDLASFHLWLRGTGSLLNPSK